MDPRYLELQSATVAPACEPDVNGSVTLAQASAVTGKSVHALRRLVKAGRLPAARIAGPRGPEYRLPPAAIAQLGSRQARATVTKAVAPPTLSTTVEHDGARVAQLEAEVAFLRETIRDLRALLLRNSAMAENGSRREPFHSAIGTLIATGRLPDVSPPRPEGTPAPAPRRPWWPWRRLAWLA